MGLDYALNRRGPLTMAPSQLGMFAKSSPDYATANVEFHVQPLSLDKFGDPLHNFPAITLSVCNLRPASRGFVHAASSDPDARAAHPAQLSQRRGRPPRRRRFDPPRAKNRRRAGAGALPPRRISAGRRRCTSDADLARRAGDIGTTIFHPVGTAKMGRDEDPIAVVDARLRLRGLDGPADRRRLGHAAHHLRQHQFADADDRGEGGGIDPRGREGVIVLPFPSYVDGLLASTLMR